MAVSLFSLEREVFTATNHLGQVFTDARILNLDTNRVLVIGKEGLGILSNTNLPNGLREEAERIAAQRERLVEEEGKPGRPRFYRGILEDWWNKKDQEKIMDAELWLKFCVNERIGIEKELSEIEANTTAAVDAEVTKVLILLRGAAKQRDTEISKCEQDFRQGRITRNEQAERVLKIERNYTATYERTVHQFGKEKWRIEGKRMGLNRDYADLGVVMHVLKDERAGAIRNVYYRVLKKILVAVRIFRIS